MQLIYTVRYYEGCNIMLEVGKESLHQEEMLALHVSIPVRTINSLKKEFSLLENEVESFIVSIIERVIAEHASKTNSKVFSETEAKELEDDLRGLGYI